MHTLLQVHELSAHRAFAAAERDGGFTGRAVLGGRFTVMLVSIEIDVLFQRSVHQGRGAEVQDHAIGLDDARVVNWVDSAQATPDHLGQCRLVRAGSQQNHAGGGREVVPFRQHSHIDHGLRAAGFVLGQSCLSLCV